MGCSACGADNPPGAKFCNGCGAPLSAACASCGHSNTPGSRFCNECGHALTALPRSSAPVRERASAPPESYTPKHLAEKILAGRDALQGERKQVTVLFADVVGSTALIRDRDPEDSQRLLDGAIQVMMSAVHRYEGTVSRLMGDGLMAMFGAPIAHEDHAVRACYAALAMLESIRAYAEEARRSFGETVEFRVGLNSGEVIVRLISDDLHMDYTAMGPTVHLAARMEGLAAAGTAVLSASTLGLVEGLIAVCPLGPMPVKGLDQPIPVYEVIGAGAARTRLHAAAARGLTRFVGRDDERLAIERALARARGGQGQVVALVGEPGVGKSRLVWEITHAAEADGWAVLQAGAASYGRAVPYLPVTDLLKAYCRIQSSDRPQEIAEKVTQRLLTLDPTLLPTVPALLALLDAPVEDAAWQALDPSGRRRATIEAVTRLLLRESRERSLLLVVEDLHWLDSESQAMLDELVESLPTARVVLLVNYRPEYTHAWGNRGHYTQLRIDSLEQASAEELLSALLGEDATVRPLKLLLIERTEGNPFFLEESVRTLVETGVLDGERGAYRLTHPIDSIRVPATVESVLAARIDRLPPEEKRLLQTAAVIGKDVPYVLLQAIAETADDVLRAGISHLQSGELLYSVSLFPELELTFKHALTHDVAYGSLLQDRRKALHARIVAAIEALYPDRLDEHVERLVHHSLRGERWEQAVDYCRRAGDRALTRSAGEEAIRFFEQALEAFEHLDPSADRASLGIDLRLDLCTAHFSVHRFGALWERAQQAEALAEAAGDRARLGSALALQAHVLRATVDHRRAVETGERAIAIAEELGDLGLRMAAADVVGASSFEMGQYDLATIHLRSSLAMLASDRAHEHFGQHIPPALHARAYLAYALAWQGDFSASMETIEEFGRIAESMGHPDSRKMANESLGLICSVHGDPTRAIAALEQSLAMARQINNVPSSMAPLAFVGYAYALSGRAEEAASSLRRALDIAEQTGHQPCASLWVGWLAEAYLRDGRLADARETGVRAVEMARANQERGFEGEAHCRLGEVALQIEPFDPIQAERHFHDALAIAEELGMRPLQAHCHLGLGKVCRRAGRAHDARSELNVAVDLYLSMEMRHWLPEAEAELAQVALP